MSEVGQKRKSSWPTPSSGLPLKQSSSERAGISEKGHDRTKRPREAWYPNLIVQGSCRDRPLDPMNFTYSVAIGDPSVMRDQVRVGVNIKANTRRPARHRIQADVGN